MSEPKRYKQSPSQNQNRPKPHKRRRKVSFSSIIAVLIVFLAFYLILSLLVAAFVLYSFHNTAESDDTYGINIIYDETKLYSLDAEEANNEYGLYIPFEYLAEIGSFGLAGDGDDVTLFIIGTDNRIKCTKNSSLVVINNNPIRISSPILYENNEYFIPVVLVEKYVNGIDVTYDSEKMMCNISSDLSKNDVALTLLLPEDMEAAYFPESYKYYDFGDESDTSDIIE